MYGKYMHISTTFSYKFLIIFLNFSDILYTVGKLLYIYYVPLVRFEWDNKGVYVGTDRLGGGVLRSISDRSERFETNGIPAMDDHDHALPHQHPRFPGEGGNVCCDRPRRVPCGNSPRLTRGQDFRCIYCKLLRTAAHLRNRHAVL